MIQRFVVSGQWLKGRVRATQDPQRAGVPGVCGHRARDLDRDSGHGGSGGSAISRHGGCPAREPLRPGGVQRRRTSADGTTPLARCLAVGRADQRGALVAAAGRAAADLARPRRRSRVRTHLPDGGEGRTVAIVDAFGYNNAESDLAVFRAHYGLPPCTTANGCFTKVDQRGGTDYPAENADWSIETALDLDAVSSACPSCNILLVQADNNGSPSLGQAVDTAADLGAVAISNSYGVAGEVPFESYYDHYYDHPGIAVTVSSGDLRQRPELPGHLAERGGGRRYDAHPGRLVAARLARVGVGGRRQRLLALRVAPRLPARSVSTRMRRTRERPPTSPLTPTARPASPSTTRWARTAGRSGAARRSPRRCVAAMYALAGDPGARRATRSTYLYRHGHVAALTSPRAADGYLRRRPLQRRPRLGRSDRRRHAPRRLGPDPRRVRPPRRDRRRPGQQAPRRRHVRFTDASGYVSHTVTDDKGRYRLAVAEGSYQRRGLEVRVRRRTADQAHVSRPESHGLAGPHDARRCPAGPSPAPSPTESGQGWPVYAKITVAGDPDGAVYTDPYTGRYSVDLPVGTTYTLHAEPVDMPGYATSTALSPSGHGVTALATMSHCKVDDSSCTAAGYAHSLRRRRHRLRGLVRGQDGWQVTDDAAPARPGASTTPGQGQPTGGSGQFADRRRLGLRPATNDTSLVSPVVDLAGQAAPVDRFRHLLLRLRLRHPGRRTSTSASTAGRPGGPSGARRTRSSRAMSRSRSHKPPAQSDVRVRFRFSGENDNYWELDNVLRRHSPCDPLARRSRRRRRARPQHRRGADRRQIAATDGTPAVSQATPDDASSATASTGCSASRRPGPADRVRGVATRPRRRRLTAARRPA